MKRKGQQTGEAQPGSPPPPTVGAYLRGELVGGMLWMAVLPDLFVDDELRTFWALELGPLVRSAGAALDCAVFGDRRTAEAGPPGARMRPAVMVWTRSAQLRPDALGIAALEQLHWQMMPRDTFLGAGAPHRVMGRNWRDGSVHEYRHDDDQTVDPADEGA